MTTKNKIFWAHLALIACALMWGSTYVLVKYILDDIQPLPEVAYRFIIAASLMSIILKIKGSKYFTHFYQGTILGLLLWIVYVPQTIGLQHTSAVNAGFIVSMYVLFVPVLSVILFKEKLSRNRIIGIILALSGLWTVSGAQGKIESGDFLVLVSALGIALHMIATSYFAKKNSDPLTLCFQQYLVIAILTTISTFIYHESWLFHKESTLYILIYLAIFPSFLAFLFQTLGEKYLSPVNTAFICILEPIFGVSLAWIFGGETIQINQILGGIAIIVAVIIAEIPNKKEKLKHSFHHHLRKNKRL